MKSLGGSVFVLDLCDKLDIVLYVLMLVLVTFAEHVDSVVRPSSLVDLW